MTLSQVSSRPRLDALTGLRFFAALVVYLSHHPQPSYLPASLSTLFLAGYNGVTLFFVLSGFVIGLNYFESLATPGLKSVYKYFTARLARIYPLYLFVLVFAWLLQISNYGPIVFHLLAMQAWSSDLSVAFAYNNPGWSVGVEFFLYACFPFVAIALAPFKHNARQLGLVALGVMLVMFAVALYFLFTGRADLMPDDPASAHRWLYRTPLTRLGDFTLGVVASLLFKQVRQTTDAFKRTWSRITYSAIFIILGLMLWQANLNSVFSWDVTYAVPCFILILGLALSPDTLASRLLSSPAMVKLGEASFALYLIHRPMMSLFHIHDLGIDNTYLVLAVWVAFFLLCVVLAIYLNAFIEIPIRQWLNFQVDRSLEKIDAR